MFNSVLVAWRDVGAVVAWSGLSLGALAVLAALVYFDPKVLKFAIAGAGAVVIAYVCTLHGNKVGLADGKAEIQAQWDAARAAEIAAAQERDAMTEQDLTAKYASQLEQLKSQLNPDSKGPDNAVANASSDGCKLGDLAVRVRK
jgi:hypothetical protein